jgi:hypothetical protein
MGNSSPKEIWTESIKQVGEVLKAIIAQLSGQPIFLFGIAAMSLAIIGLVATALVPNIASQLTWFPYALLLFGLVLIALAYSRVSKQGEQVEAQGLENSWPRVKNVRSLAIEISNLSINQRTMLRIISDENGIYAFRLAKRLGISREEAVYRCKELVRQELIVIKPLSDYEYRIPESLKPLFRRKTILGMLTIDPRSRGRAYDPMDQGEE